MKKIKLFSLAAIAFLLIGSLVLLTGCPGEDPPGGEDTLYTVTFNGNTNTGGTAPAAITQSAEGAAVTIPGVGTLVKTGHKFDGWNTLADGNGIEVAAGPFTPTGNITLFAQWSPLASDEYVITLVADPTAGGSFTNISDVAITSITAKASVPALFKVVTNATHTLTSVKAGEANVPIEDGIYAYTQSVTTPVTITATFEEIPPVEIDFTINYNGLTGTGSTVKKNIGDIVQKPADPTEFLGSFVYSWGWFDAAEGGNQIFFPYTLTGDITIYAREAFADRNDYDIYNHAITWSADNYLALWNYQQYMSQASKPGSLMLIFINPRTLTAGNIFTVNRWMPGSTEYAIPVSELIPLPPGVLGADVLPADIIGSSGARGSSPDNQSGIGANPTRNQITEADLANVKVLDFARYSAWTGWNVFGEGLRNHEMSAVTVIRVETWVPKGEGGIPDVRFTVTFDGNGNESGTAPSPVTQTSTGAAVIIPDGGDMGKPGLVFGGWNTLPTGGSATMVEPGSYTPRRSITLYAQWVLPGDPWDRENFTITNYELKDYTVTHGEIPVALPASLTTALTAAKGITGSKLVFFINAGPRYDAGGNLIAVGLNSNLSATGQVHLVNHARVVKPMPASALPARETIIGRIGSTKVGSKNQLITIANEHIVDATMVLYSWPETEWNLVIGGTPANNMLSISGTEQGNMLVAVQGNDTNAILYLLLVELWVPKE